MSETTDALRLLEAETAFQTLFAWVQAGEAEPNGDEPPYKWERDRWRAIRMSQSPAGPFRELRNDTDVMYLRPAKTGFGYMRRLDLRASATIDRLIAAAAAIDKARTVTVTRIDGAPLTVEFPVAPRRTDVGSIDQAVKAVARSLASLYSGNPDECAVIYDAAFKENIQLDYPLWHVYIEDARAALTAALPHMGADSGWQAIGTYDLKRHPAVVLVAYECGHVSVAEYSEISVGGPDDHMTWTPYIRPKCVASWDEPWPTHWRPLPPPPEDLKP